VIITNMGFEPEETTIYQLVVECHNIVDEFLCHNIVDTKKYL